MIRAPVSRESELTPMKKIILITILFVITSFGCELLEDDLPDAVTSEIGGKYLYKYPTGEVEVLYMNMDSTYEQEVYINEKSYLNNSKPMCKNNNTWSISGKKIYFRNWLMCSDFGLDFDTIKHKPNIAGYPGAGWRKPNKKRKEYKIYFYYENGYVFAKQTDTIPVYHVHNIP